MSHTAILGAGLIGAGMAHNLVQKGERVAVWNRSPEKAEQLAAAHAGVVTAHAAIGDAVRGAARVHLILNDDASVDAALAAVVGAVDKGVVVVDHTTTAPVPTAARAAALREKGVRFVHAPIFMSPGNAKNGTGLMLVCGDADDVSAVTPSLAKMTGDVWNVGTRADAAAAYKLFGNAMILTMMGALADIFKMADQIGLPRQDALTVFEKFSPMGVVQFRGPKMAKREFTPPSFQLETARKDLRLMQETAGTADTAVLEGLARRMDQLIKEGFGNDDVGALAR